MEMSFNANCILNEEINFIFEGMFYHETNSNPFM